MVALQIISKILATKDISILEDNLLSQDYFVGYENEYDFLVNHNKEYGYVPDKAVKICIEKDLEKGKDYRRIIIGEP